MAYVNYVEVGKEVLVAGIGGTMAGYIHFMFLEPQVAGMAPIMGINMATVVDLIVGFIVGIATTMYARGTLAKILGYGVAGTLVAVGLLQQLGVLPSTTQTVRVVRTPTGALTRTVAATPSVGTYPIG